MANAKPESAAPVTPAPAPARRKTAPPPDLVFPCKVRATQLCYYGEKRRYVGDVFTVFAPEQFSLRYMDPVPLDTPERVTPNVVAHAKVQQDLKDMKAAGTLPKTDDGNPLA